MKIKMDFVTNSSSTSFCAWGVCTDIRELIRNDACLVILKEKYIESGDVEKDISDENFISFLEDDIYEVYEVIENIFYSKFGMSAQCTRDYDGDNIYIGIHPDKIPKDKTIQEAIDQAQHVLLNMGIGRKITWIQEAWFDG